MLNYPNIFDEEFVNWWFAQEDALARGETPPPRPKPMFLPKALREGYQSTSQEDLLTELKTRRSRNKFDRKQGFQKPTQTK
jgi:hypothetical protein